MRKRVVLFLFPVLLAAGCTFIDPLPGSEKVVVAKPDHVAYCVRLGQTKVNVLDKAGFIERDPAKIRADLELLARNSAVEMGGDTLVAATPISEGSQTFTVYRCRR
ncbi:protein of unknown function [Formivibrio citricus]|uniref:DUF4156 domain-containing protein n=1 Tax=Formivibrio citricus TaxID=83765 RepID=A0A1I5DS84_9NEIS|nr:DUF4156 domain-containing protein [Formivibrio citricus]SFO01641.1 protein of unknown function [Formivibrio citricus]